MELERDSHWWGNIKRELENSSQFGIVKGAFAEGNKCVDAVCGLCKMTYGDSDHSCGNCNQKIYDYKDEYNQKMMMRERVKWGGTALENCAICGIVLRII